MKTPIMFKMNPKNIGKTRRNNQQEKLKEANQPLPKSISTAKS